LRGADLLDCTYLSPGPECGGTYHPYWAIDIGAPEGRPIYASGSGLARVYSDSTACDDSYGRAVAIDHGGGVRSLYAHMSRFSDALAASPSGVWVDRDTVIGRVGHTGNVSGCSYDHLHYEQTTNGAFFTSATEPSPMFGCVDGALVVYPLHWGQAGWGGLPGRTYTARSDGTSCERPGDGVVVRTPDHRTWRVTGGAPLPVGRCDAPLGCAGVVDVPDLAGYRTHPHDGTLARAGGGLYRFAGGAPLWIGSCAAASACPDAADLPAGALDPGDHARPVPRDGTYLTDAEAGRRYRVAGGAALPLSDCAVLDGRCHGAVEVTSATLATHAQGRLHDVPADGTHVQGEPSGAVWRFRDGARMPDAAAVGVRVNDSTVESFPELSSSAAVAPDQGAAPQPARAPAAIVLPSGPATAGRVRACARIGRRLVRAAERTRAARKALKRARGRAARRKAKALVRRRTTAQRKLAATQRRHCH
jgi:hypothetical protein